MILSTVTRDEETKTLAPRLSLRREKRLEDFLLERGLHAGPVVGELHHERCGADRDADPWLVVLFVGASEVHPVDRVLDEVLHDLHGHATDAMHAYVFEATG